MYVDADLRRDEVTIGPESLKTTPTHGKCIAGGVLLWRLIR
jgi:hypothetical protein